MLAAVIIGPTTEEALRQIRSIKADLYELRLDLFTSFDLQVLKKLDVPLILTFKGVEPAYIDAPSGNLLSYHNFQETPENLEEIYDALREKPAALYKIATFANTTLDTMRLLLLQKKAGSGLCAIAMGDLGKPSRILGPIFGNPITYAAADTEEKTAPGQLTVKELANYPVDTKTRIYGLIGNVEQSISHITHNAQFRRLGLNAVYVKFKLSRGELPQFLNDAKLLGIKGLSVTSPLKEAILPYLDAIDEEAAHIGAVNTLKFVDGKIFGSNTDAIGAQKAIRPHIKLAGKRVQIYGAGGAARAIAYICKKEGAEVFIENRTKEKARELADRFGCLVGLCSSPDLVINCTTTDFACEAPIGMDINVRPKERLFLQNKQKIYGLDMFFHQAVGQFEAWFDRPSNAIAAVISACGLG